MSVMDYDAFVEPEKVPRFSPEQVRMSLAEYPPFLEPLLGMWARLSRESFRGVTTDGRPVTGLFPLQPSGAPIEAAARAATRWLDALDPSIRARMQFPLNSDLWRQWHNTPLVLQDGQILLSQLDIRLRELALEVVRASLSQEGYARTREVMANNLFLGQLIDMTGVLNDWAFSLSIFGTPSTGSPWGWQFFGHHLALNCLFIDGQMVLSPVFMGLEPDHDLGLLRRRMFEPHEQQALKLIRSLSDAERASAVLYDSMLKGDQPEGRYHPDDGRQQGGAYQDNRIVPYEGAPASSFGAEQRRELLALAELFIEIMPDGPAEARLREIERHLASTYFAWVGKHDDVNPFYFRIHSPVALIEFDHHSGIFLANEEPARFHVHTIVRTPNGGDYGFDLLRQHYAQGGHDHSPGHSHDAGAHAHSHDGGKSFHSHD